MMKTGRNLSKLHSTLIYGFLHVFLHAPLSLVTDFVVQLISIHQAVHTISTTKYSSPHKRVKLRKYKHINVNTIVTKWVVVMTIFT